MRKIIHSLIILILVLVSTNVYSAQKQIVFIQEYPSGEIDIQYKSFNDKQVDRLLKCFPNVLAMKEGHGNIYILQPKEIINFYKYSNFLTQRVEKEYILRDWGFELLVQEIPTIYSKNDEGYIISQYGDVEIDIHDIFSCVFFLLFVVLAFVLYGVIETWLLAKMEIRDYISLSDDIFVSIDSYFDFLGNYFQQLISMFISQVFWIGILTAIVYNIFSYLDIIQPVNGFLVSIAVSLILYSFFPLVIREDYDWQLNYAVYPFTVVIIYLVRHSVFANGVNITWSNLLPIWILLFIGLVAVVVSYHLLARALKNK